MIIKELEEKIENLYGDLKVVNNEKTKTEKMLIATDLELTKEKREKQKVRSHWVRKLDKIVKYHVKMHLNIQ